MERKSITMAALTNDDDGFAQAQAVAGAGNLTENGALVSSGAATFAAAQKVVITSSGNDSGITFTVTGTNADGVTISETITGGNATTAKSSKYFKTVTNVAASDAAAGTVKVGTLAADGAVSPTIEVDLNKAGDNFKDLIEVNIGAGTYSVQSTADAKGDTWTESIQEEGTWVAQSGLSGLTADAQVLATLPAKAVRLIFTAYTSGTTRMNILLRGRA